MVCRACFFFEIEPLPLPIIDSPCTLASIWYGFVRRDLLGSPLFSLSIQAPPAAIACLLGIRYSTVLRVQYRRYYGYSGVPGKSVPSTYQVDLPLHALLMFFFAWYSRQQLLLCYYGCSPFCLLYLVVPADTTDSSDRGLLAGGGVALFFPRLCYADIVPPRCKFVQPTVSYSVSSTGMHIALFLTIPCVMSVFSSIS